MDLGIISKELERNCCLLSDSLKELTGNPCDHPSSSIAAPNPSIRRQEDVSVSNIVLHEVCQKTSDMLQKDLVILGVQSQSFSALSQRIVSSLLPNDSALKYSVMALDKVWRDSHSLELLAHSFAYVIVLNKEFLSWLTSKPDIIIGRLIRSPNKTIGIFIGDGKYLSKGHRDQLIHFHRWNRVLSADLSLPKTTDKLIKVTLERILAYSNASGSSFKVISPQELVSWKRNRLLLLLQGQELDINSRVELEINKGLVTVQNFTPISSQVIEFSLPPFSDPPSIELLIDGSSLGRAHIKLRDPHAELYLINSCISESKPLFGESQGYISLSEAQGHASRTPNWRTPIYYSVPKIRDYDVPPTFTVYRILAMGKVSSQSFYAVARGRQIGIYNSWSECRSQTHGFTNARFKKFSSYEEANNFVKENSNKSSSGVQRVFKAGKKSKENTAGQINRVVSAEEGWSVDERDWNYDPDLGYTLNKEGWVKVFTDGACSNNGQRGAVAGIGAYFGPGSPKNISEPVSGDHQTNNSAEIQAISQAIQSVKNEGRTKVVIYTDSKFAINSVELWLEGWKKNGWKKSSGGDVINKADFIQLDDIRKGMSVKFIHVRGHQGIHGNEMADQLAREGAQ